MCTLLILFRPKTKWPVIIAGNRDEMNNRPWLSPGKHWKNHSNIIAGKDTVAGGSWLGINTNGIICTILNRQNSLGPDKTKLSRGEIIINILKNKNMSSVLNYIKLLDSSKWRPFNLFIADNKNAYWAKNTENNNIELNPIKKGKHFLDSHDLNSIESDRYSYNIKEYTNLPDPDPDIFSWNEWIEFLARTSHPKNKPLAAMNIKKHNDKDYGTLCSSILALPSDKIKNIKKPIFLFNKTSPDIKKFYSINTC